MWRLLVVLSLSGCQCFQPVDEDAGVMLADAAVVQDAGPECSTAADCTGTPRVTAWCQTILQADAGFSCVDQRCVSQCSDSAGQTCFQDLDVECLRCPPTTSCIPPSCGSGAGFSYTVTEVACTGVAPLSVGARVHQRASSDGGCGVQLLLQTDAGEEPWGLLYLQSARGLSARIPSLGGTCLVSDLPTGAPRMLIDCPRCQVGLGP